MSLRLQELVAHGVDSRFISALESLIEAHIHGIAQARVDGLQVKPYDPQTYVKQPRKVMPHNLEAVSRLGDSEDSAELINLAFKVPAPPVTLTYQIEKVGSPALQAPCQGQDSCLEDLDVCFTSKTKDSPLEDLPGTGHLAIARRPRRPSNQSLSSSVCSTNSASGVSNLEKYRVLRKVAPSAPFAPSASLISSVCSTCDKVGSPDETESTIARASGRRFTSVTSAESFQISDYEEPSSMMVHRSLSTAGFAFEKSVSGNMRGQNGIGILGRIVDHPAFESLFALLIFLNTITIVLESQYEGVNIGHKLGFPGYGRSADDIFPAGLDVLNVLDLVFGMLFTFEVILKLASLRLRFFCSGWNVFDFVIMTFWTVSKFYDTSDLANPTMLRLLRLLKVMRIVRLFKTISSVDSLMVLIKSIKASFAAFVWSTCLVLIMITFVSLIAHTLIISYFENEARPIEGRRQVFGVFGTFSLTAASFFEATLGNFAPVMRILMENVDESWSVFLIAYKLVGGFAVVTVILGVFLQETFKVANSDDELLLLQRKRQLIKHMTKMTLLFEAADTSKVSVLTWEAFLQMCKDPFIKSWLSAYEFEVSDAKVVFDLIANADGAITVDELMDGVSRLKGSARSIDLHVALHHVTEVKELLYQTIEDLKEMRQQLQ